MDRRDHAGATDTQLTIAASHGDDEAFAELYERYAPRIRGYLTRLLNDEHLAQDLAHEVFVSALRRLREDRPPIAVGPWLYRIARNASIDVHRRSQVVRQVPLERAGNEAAGGNALDSAPEQAAEVRQWIEHLRYLLDGLSDAHRTVLVLRELEGLSNTEIGDRLGISRPAVEGLLFRARTKVREEYEDLASGRRCETVRETLDRAGARARLGRRDARAASRHLSVCPPCRRHAWEAGVVAAVHDRAAGARAVLPVPAALGLFAERLHARLHVLGRPVVDLPAALSLPWGRAAAAVTAAVVAGAAIAPHVGSPGTARPLRRPSPLHPLPRWPSPRRRSPRPPLRRPRCRRPAGARVRTAPAVAPAGAPPASPAAAPVELPAEPEPQREATPAPVTQHARADAAPSGGDAAAEPAAELRARRAEHADAPRRGRLRARARRRAGRQLRRAPRRGRRRARRRGRRRRPAGDGRRRRRGRRPGRRGVARARGRDDRHARGAGAARGARAAEPPPVDLPEPPAAPAVPEPPSLPESPVQAPTPPAPPDPEPLPDPRKPGPVSLR